MLGFLRAHGWVFVIVTVLTLMLVVTDALRPKLPTWYTYEAAPDRSQEHWLAFDWRV
ncbi:hypothetical protein JL101_035485 (plasmid) [Skermanella rosea]|uniref:hypothetical protein n=1 Tax=Skermanella rosea TaxID=1817965 RepID=UPI0019323BC1|nr:hypothetical protein [Skermanella rosea]UEM08102.1 hypothetical protein JL101_035485 [Skermanella rosea]